MSHNVPVQNLNEMTTQWTLWLQAHHGSETIKQSAQEQLLRRYGGAIQRYLRGAVRHPEMAEELFQDFSVRFLQGRLHGADPQRGRLRDFLKGVLFRIVADHFKQQQKKQPALPLDHAEPAVEAPLVFESDERFLASWKEDLLARSWEALAEAERLTGQPYYQVLRLRSENPNLPSPKMAEQLSAKLNKSITAAGARQLLHRARVKFADLLLREVVHSMDNPTLEQLEEELTELGLLEYCRPALARAVLPENRKPLSPPAD